MGALSSRPNVPAQPQTVFVPHENLKECHDALDYLSGLGSVSLKRTPKTYTMTLNYKGYDISFRGKSLCHALKGLIEKHRRQILRGVID